jgi:hypothetical protein
LTDRQRDKDIERQRVKKTERQRDIPVFLVDSGKPSSAVSLVTVFSRPRKK